MNVETIRCLPSMCAAVFFSILKLLALALSLDLAFRFDTTRGYVHLSVLIPLIDLGHGEGSAAEESSPTSLHVGGGCAG